MSYKSYISLAVCSILSIGFVITCYLSVHTTYRQNYFDSIGNDAEHPLVVNLVIIGSIIPVCALITSAFCKCMKQNISYWMSSVTVLYILSLIFMVGKDLLYFFDDALDFSEDNYYGDDQWEYFFKNYFSLLLSDILLGALIIQTMRNCFKNTSMRLRCWVLLFIFCGYCASVFWLIRAVFDEREIAMNWWTNELYYFINCTNHYLPKCPMEDWGCTFPCRTYCIQSTTKVAVIQYWIVSTILGCILTALFNFKLYKYIQISQLNDPYLSEPDRKFCIQRIMTKNNIIFWIAFYHILFTVTNSTLFSRWNTATEIFIFGDFSPALWYYSLFMLCILVTMNLEIFNGLYNTTFKHLERFCLCYTRHLSEENERNEPLLINLTPEPIILIKGKCNIQSCDHLKSVLDAMVSNQQSETSLNIINSFHHLLDCHDDATQFHIIYHKFKQLNLCEMNYDCENYLRHKRQIGIDRESNHRRTYFDRLLDQIHVYYLHSYQMMYRLDPETIDIEIDEEHDELLLLKIRKLRKSPQSLLSHKYCTNLIIDDIEQHEDRMNVYSVGERFNYDHKEKGNLDCYPKYKCIKEEAIANDIYCIHIDEFGEIWEKTELYINDHTTKIISKGCNKLMSKEELLSLLLYTDCTAFQQKWSETFRRIPATERDKELIERHSHFYHISMNLRNLVEYFGINGREHKEQTFYHGITLQLCFTQTITQFNCPLSTSTEQTVAANFATNDGIILALNYHSSVHPYLARYFDCSKFSAFNNEKECLFVGGMPIVVIKNIINQKMEESYKEYIDAFNVLNSIFMGQIVSANSLSIEQCSDMIRNKCLNGYPVYIQQMFNQFTSNLSQIYVSHQRFVKNKQIKTIFYHLCNPMSFFFDLKVLLSLFPNVMQIEWYKEGNIDMIVKYIIHQINNNEIKPMHIILHSNRASIDECNDSLNKQEWQMNIRENEQMKALIFHHQDLELIQNIRYQYDQVIEADTTEALRLNLQ